VEYQLTARSKCGHRSHGALNAVEYFRRKCWLCEQAKAAKKQALLPA
jgi:hypothetical protein